MFIIKVYVAAPTFNAANFHLMQVMDIGDVILKPVRSKFGRDRRGKATDD